MTLANRDATGLRNVRRGHLVVLHNPENRGAVVKLCRGSCLVKWPDEAYAKPHDCKDLTIVRRIQNG